MKKLAIIGILMAFAGFMMAGSAQASPTLTLTVTDSSSGSGSFTQSSFPPATTFSFNPGDGFSASGSFGGTQSTNAFSMDVGSTTISSTAAGTVTLDLKWTGLTATISPVGVTLTASGSIVSGTASETLTGITGSTTAGPFTVALTGSNVVETYAATVPTSPSTYSAEEIITINLGASSTASLSETSTDNSQNGSVPEPATLLLYGAGLAAVGLYRKFRA